MSRAEALLFEGVKLLQQLGQNHSEQIRMIDERLSALEQPTTVAADAGDLHPVALKLAEAYRIGHRHECADVDMVSLMLIRNTWCRITGHDDGPSTTAILAYGKR